MKLEVDGVEKRVRWERTMSPVVQNLGPGRLYVSRRQGAASEGMRLEPGGTLAFGGPLMDSGAPVLYLQGAENPDEGDLVECDVRLEPGGTLD